MARRKHVFIWLQNYLLQRFTRMNADPPQPTHILFCHVDHFEPTRHEDTREQSDERMRRWTEDFPKFADRHRDSNGRVLQHTFFYPGEEYDACYLDQLARLCSAGYGEIELHHHHHFFTSEKLSAALCESLDHFALHGACVYPKTDRTETWFGFIHGNMALDNSRGDDQWCGVNNELILLQEAGCYADFSAPTAPCVSQTRKINSIYYAVDDPDAPKSHDTGTDVRVGGSASGNLMIIQGPLCLCWRKWKLGIMPTIDNAEIQQGSPFTVHRMRNWVRAHIHVKGRPEWVIVKLSSHGAEDRNKDVLLGKSADEFFSAIEQEYSPEKGYFLHYVNARELYNIVKAAEAGQTGDPSKYRDFLIPKPQYILLSELSDSEIQR
jgi:hypothetical protein